MTATLPPIQSDGGEAFKTVGYTRVSTSRQHTEGLGLPIQEESIRRYCKSRPDLELITIYTDAGISGSQIQNRPALLQLLDDAKAGKFKLVVVPKLDRIARDTFYTLWIEKELKRYGVSLFSIGEPYRWSDPAQKVFLQIISSFAEYERARITERLLAGRMKKLQNGGYAGGQPPFGYTNQNGRLVVNPPEAFVVRRINQLRSEHCSYREIARILHDEGFRPRRSARFDNTSVRYIALSPVYKGFIRYQKTAQGSHEKII